MDIKEILAVFDQERRDLPLSGSRREVTSSLARDVALDGGTSWITYSHHSAASIDAAIEAQIDYFSRIGHGFEWKVFDHDRPPNLRERLLAHGFTAGEPEAFMALDLLDAPAALLAPVTHDVRRVVSPDDLADYRTVSVQAWGREEAGHIAFVAELLRDCPDEIGVYVAYVHGTPASCARASFQRGSQFAGMWAGATVPAFRNQGLYQALVATRVQEARRRGYRYMTIDALPTSRPIVERHGFRFLTYTHPLVWHPPCEGA
ncbi:MAG: GNAT family N-acetyltransferase [Chloroflexota bacterium]|nr:GNAT family N-acetyltransferase [Chloroflexota bacterium]